MIRGYLNIPMNLMGLVFSDRFRFVHLPFVNIFQILIYRTVPSYSLFQLDHIYFYFCRLLYEWLFPSFHSSLNESKTHQIIRTCLSILIDLSVLDGLISFSHVQFNRSLF